jgi:hypothetical protein
MTDLAAPPPCPIPTAQMEAAVLRHTGDQTPAPLRLMAARGMAPMTPRDLVTAQFVLTFDSDPRVRQTAADGLANLDPRIANAVLGDALLHPSILDHLAALHATNDAYAEKLLLNGKTSSRAFAKVAEVCSEQTCELIASNQARILESPDIARALTRNGNALRSTVDRVVDFLVRSGVVLEGVQQFEDALLRLSGDDRKKAADFVDLPKHLLDDVFLTDEDQDEVGERRLIAEDEELENNDDVRKRVEDQLRFLTIGQKVALATKGNRSVRLALMRDTNRLVALAAITSPAITEQEVVSAAQSRTVHQDVVGHICRDKKNNWVRNYQIRSALVFNPKTPLAEAMKLVPLLNPRDIKMAAKSKNIPAGVRTLATKMAKGTEKPGAH